MGDCGADHGAAGAAGAVAISLLAAAKGIRVEGNRFNLIGLGIAPVWPKKDLLIKVMA